MKKIRKAVIPAAGFGTRFLPATKATPKEMLPIVDKPTIQYIVEEALQSGIEEILIISGHAKRAIEDHFDTNPGLNWALEGSQDGVNMVRSISEINIHYIRQKHMRGLGDAILCAQSFIADEPFAILLGDDVVYNETNPALRQMIDLYNDLDATILGCQEVPLEKVSSYGIVQGTPVEGKDILKVSRVVESRPSKKHRAGRPSWAAISSRRTSLKSWPIPSRARAGKSSSPTPLADHGPRSRLCLLLRRQTLRRRR